MELILTGVKSGVSRMRAEVAAHISMESYAEARDVHNQMIGYASALHALTLAVGLPPEDRAKVDAVRETIHEASREYYKALIAAGQDF
jgi:hypothetical protein